MKSMRWLVLISGLLLVVMGVFMLGRPVASLVGIAIYISISFLISGLFEIIAYFSHKKEVRSAWLLVSGAITFFLGAWMLFSDYGLQNFILILTIVFPIWLLISSIVMAVNAFDLKKVGYKNWLWNLIIGVLGIFAGFSLLFSPVTTALTLSFSLAFIVIYKGVTDIVFFFATRKHSSDDELV